MDYKDIKIELTELEVELIVKELSLKLFNKKFNLLVKRDDSLTQIACFTAKQNNITKKLIPDNIRCSQKIYDGTYKLNTVIGALVHELCHWWLCENKQYCGEDEPAFKELLKKFGAPDMLEFAGECYRYSCSKCGEFLFYYNTDKYSNDKYTSKCCEVKLAMEKVYMGDTNDIKLSFDTMNLEIAQNLINKKLKDETYRRYIEWMNKCS